MGEVVKARLCGSAGFQRDVVLKKLHARNLEDSAFATMFADEARLLGFLRHPNVVQALDFYEESGQRFLVLEYIEGASLSDVFRDGRDVSPAIIAFVGREICRALDYVHHVRAADGTPLGVVHHDVTPSNIMVSTEGEVKLLDFGLARFAFSRHVADVGTVKGKPSYLAPEQLGTRPVDGRVDLFALGIVMHELLTGTRLFRGEDDMATLKQIVGAKKVVAPSKARAGIPRALDRIVLRALERDPSRRYPNAAAMARDLDEVVLSSRLGVTEVAAFARDMRSTARAMPHWSPSPTDEVAAQAETRRDLRLPPSRWARFVPSGRRAALVAGVGLALGLGTLGVGARFRAARAPLVGVESVPAATVERSSRADLRGTSVAKRSSSSARVSLAEAL
ncbi:MAG: Serine/threonine protein kinase PrkC, regulator of stationary phase [Myxococcales bacterium]|nr:Serine/threonine protein kinase PrkC, regulator of stationary phase [Myxococcales bacterium]